MQLRNAIVEKFKQKHLKREHVPTALLGHLLDELEKQVDKFLRAEKISQDKLQKLDGMLHDLVQREVVSYQRDGIVGRETAPRARQLQHHNHNSRSLLPSLRSSTPLGLSNLSSVASEAKSVRSSLKNGRSIFSEGHSRVTSPKSVIKSPKAGEVMESLGNALMGCSSLSVRASLKRNTEWNRIVLFNTRKYKDDMRRLKEEESQKR